MTDFALRNFQKKSLACCLICLKKKIFNRCLVILNCKCFYLVKAFKSDFYSDDLSYKNFDINILDYILQIIDAARP